MSIPQNSALLQPIATAAFSSLVSGGLHSLAARLFTSITPLTGGVFGIAFCMSGNAINYAWDKIIDRNDPCTTIAKYAVQYFSSLALGSLATSLVGPTITFKAALLLNLSTLGTIFGGAICLAAITAGVAAAVVVIKAYHDDTTLDASLEDCAAQAFHQTANLLGMTDQGLMQVVENSIKSMTDNLDNASQWLQADTARMNAQRAERNPASEDPEDLIELEPDAAELEARLQARARRLLNGWI